MLTKSTALWAFLTALASAHTWVEQMAVIAEDGSFSDAVGYPRGFVARDNPSFKDPDMVASYPPSGRQQPIALDAPNRIIPTDLTCMPSQDSPSKQDPQYPQLVTKPGDYVALRYKENGHVSLPDNQPGKPGSGGLVYVYATTQSNVNPKLLDVMTWKSGSDVPLSQGRLLSVQNFDDDRCHENDPPRSDGKRNFSPERQQQFPNNGDLACETNIQIPTDAAGPVTLYWVWQWPWLPNQTHPDGSFVEGSIKVGKDETYTTCMDVNVVKDAGQVKALSSAGANLKGASYAGLEQKNAIIRKAVENYKDRAANVTLPTVQAFYGPDNPTGLPRPGNAAAPPASGVAPSKGARPTPTAIPSASSPSRPSASSRAIRSFASSALSSSLAAPSAPPAISQQGSAQAVSMVTKTVTVTAMPSGCIAKAPTLVGSTKAATKTRTTDIFVAPTGPARVRQRRARFYGDFN